MKKIIDWILDSNRLWHFLIFYAVGFGANDWYCCEYAGIGMAGSLEFKDKQWGGKWDWWDFSLSVLGANLGHLTRWLIFGT